MQKRSDPRHQKRISIIKNLFSYQFNKKQPVAGDAKEVVAKLSKIDKIITKYAPSWPLEQTSPLDLAILRLAVFELLNKKDLPYKVTVDEAVEIAKEYGSETSFEFVNGVLGTIIEKELGIRELEN